MSRFRGREIDDVALWSNYIDVPFDVNGSRFWSKVVCPNPEHDTMKKHFQVDVGTGLVHCFARCGISGAYLHAIKVIEGCNDKQAQKIILGHVGRRRKRTVPDSRHTRGSVENGVDLAFESFIPPAGMEYLESREITAGSIARWGIGWCPESLRIVIPAKDIRGQTRFLIKRAVRSSQFPKYLYSAGYAKNHLLFGALTISAHSGSIVVVEGSIDAIRLSQHGIPVVATLGTGISKEQARILDRLRPKLVYLMMDKDMAGIQGIEIAARMLPKVPLFVCRYPRGKSDPAELTEKEALRSIARAIPLRKFNRVKQQSVRRLITYGTKS